MGDSFKKCFEDSYCFAVIELVNRNFGPVSVMICNMFCERRHKAAGLAGTERVLLFLQETDNVDCSSNVHLSPVYKYFSIVLIVAYWACLWLYTAAVPVFVMALYCLYSFGQTALYSLIIFQYYVLERGYARVNQLLEATDVRGDLKSTRRSLISLADTHNDISRLVEHLNRAYTVALLVKFPYNIVRVIMVVFRIIELSANVNTKSPFAKIVIFLIVEHVGEILLFLLQLVSFSSIGTRVSNQAGIFFLLIIQRNRPNSFVSVFDVSLAVTCIVFHPLLDYNNINKLRWLDGWLDFNLTIIVMFFAWMIVQ